MTLQKREIKRFGQAGALLLAGILLLAGTETMPSMKTEASAYTGEKDARAGVVGELGSLQAEAYASSLKLQDSGVTVVAAGTAADTAEGASSAAEDTVQEEGTAAAADEWASKVVANVDSQMNVRDSASEAGAVVGYLRKGDVAAVLSRADGWTQISSGNVTGYVSDRYLLFGADAHALADSLTPYTATSNADGLRIRSDASTDASVVTTLDSGKSVNADAAYDTAGGWVRVSVKGGSGYVNAAYVTLARNYPAAVTVEEQQAIEAAKKKAAEEAAAKKAAAEQKAAAKAGSSNQTSYDGSTATQNAASTASVDDTTLLAALIWCEAGNQPFDGQVAVGAVVLNRVRSGAYPSSISGVIYQRGQFGPASSGKLARAIANGNFCTSAAQAALAGSDPTGGATCFKSASSGRAGLVIGAHVFY